MERGRGEFSGMAWFWNSLEYFRRYENIGGEGFGVRFYREGRD